MKDIIIAYDIGTGGIKASLFGADGTPLAEEFREHRTYYPGEGMVEQAPADWWEGTVSVTRALMEKSGCRPGDLAAAALSGHSLVAVPTDSGGALLLDRVPIWCDMRAAAEADEFFRNVPYDEWYPVTGNGDPPQTYTVMKLMWMKKHMPEVCSRTARIMGSKDYVNYLLTGRICTDPSYASGFGVFSLENWDYEPEFIRASGIRPEVFPEIVPSDSVIGTVTAKAAAETGLPEGLPVACGAVDNTCMSLGATGIAEGEVYASLGSSAWLAVTSRVPIIDIKTRPFVFAHVKKGLYTSGVSIFSAGNSFRWIRDLLYGPQSGTGGVYDLMNEEAARVPAGSRGVLFNPTLAGGSAQEPSPDLKGGFMGLTLSTTRADMTRAAMEGIAMALRLTLDILRTRTDLSGAVLLTGGCSKSALWRRIFCDVFGIPVRKTSIDQDAASLGAAAAAAVSVGLWPGYDRIPELHVPVEVLAPQPDNVLLYSRLLEKYREWTDSLAKLS